jgi:hypothetical protein
MEPSLPVSTSFDSISASESADTSRPSPSSSASTRPSHYKRLSPQPIEVIEGWGLNFSLGSAVKYIARAGHKEDELRDLRKAIWFLRRHLAVREAQLKGLPAPPPEDQE